VLQSEVLAHATRSEILTQHDGVEFMRESYRNRECVAVIDKLLIRVPKPVLSLTRNLARGCAGRNARDKFPRREIRA